MWREVLSLTGLELQFVASRYSDCAVLTLQWRMVGPLLWVDCERDAECGISQYTVSAFASRDISQYSWTFRTNRILILRFESVFMTVSKVKLSP
jgi:hypothetical protein